jgi:hypothetical protein
VTLLEALASGKPFRRPEFGKDCYWKYSDAGAIIYEHPFGQDVIVLGDDLTREDVFALDWEIEE